ncbi:MAG: hypothetical protein LBV45_04570 [Xanthomonadaceae bacterium]|jgi:nucleoside-diphosphate-sugar epimerase|nr:hypothetical protein [Xanthomonadaceae bacterium]
MSIFVTGATSQIGHFLLPRLREKGFSVVALSRRMQETDNVGVRWLAGELPHSPPLSDLPLPLQAIVSFGPLQGLAEWLSRASAAPAPRLIATSSMSVLSKRASTVQSERRLVQQLADGEAEVIVQCERLRMAWTLLRPTLIYGAGLDKSLTPIAQRAVRWRVFPLPAGDGMRQPVHADDLATAVLRCLENEDSYGKTLSIGGGERLPAAEMFSRVRGCLPVWTLPVTLGMPVLRLLSALLPFARGPVSRLRSDLIADNTEIGRILGIRPREFRPDASMFGLSGGVQHVESHEE